MLSNFSNQAHFVTQTYCNKNLFNELVKTKRSVFSILRQGETNVNLVHKKMEHTFFTFFSTNMFSPSKLILQYWH